MKRARPSAAGTAPSVERTVSGVERTVSGVERTVSGVERTASRVERTIARLEPLLTAARTARMQAVLASRSEHVAFVFERMIDPHNLSAALRSLDAFSFQDAYLVHPGERLGLARGITIGAERWLSMHEAPSAERCAADLKDAGYTVYASHLGAGAAVPLTELDWSRRTALVFGNEHLGVSDELLALADGTFRIETSGFVQSLNLSVAVAVSAFHARRELARLAATDAQPGRFGLAPTRRRALYAAWLRTSVKHAERILAEPDADPQAGGSRQAHPDDTSSHAGN